MESKILQGVKPFNEFWFKSCYCHALLSIYNYFNLEPGVLLFSELTYLADLDGAFKPLYRVSPLLTRYKLQTIKAEQIIKYIDQNLPIIIGADCFYLSERAEAFNKTHMQHFVLAYGYDKEKGTINIIDHNYVNSYNFVETTIKIDELIRANESFKEHYSLKFKCIGYLFKTKSIINNFDVKKSIIKSIIKMAKECSVLTDIANKLSKNNDKLAFCIGVFAELKKRDILLKYVLSRYLGADFDELTDKKICTINCLYGMAVKSFYGKSQLNFAKLQTKIHEYNKICQDIIYKIAGGLNYERK